MDACVDRHECHSTDLADSPRASWAAGCVCPGRFAVGCFIGAILVSCRTNSVHCNRCRAYVRLARAASVGTTTCVLP